MTPQQKYQQDLADNIIVADAQQAKAIDALQKLFDVLQSKHNKKCFFNIFEKKVSSIRGIYFFGPVGTGKTYLLDTFFSSLSDSKRPITKWRIHFYGFMKMIHENLKKLEGKKNPLDIIAKDIRQKSEVLCFDEFFVADIVDAMMLGNLLKALFKQKICLVTTSNIHPDELYKDGLQRELFIPAIELLKDNLEIISVDNQVDYRLRKLTHANTYFYPLDEKSQHFMEMQFEQFSQGAIQTGVNIQIMGREIPVVKVSDNAVWFEFEKICSIPRSQRDYLEIAERFNTVFISGVHAVSAQENDRIVLLISLVDVLYDAKVKLVLSAQDRVETLYTQGELLFQFNRTRSRLIEMQSQEYLDS
jgi:cell division protein ZapE